MNPRYKINDRVRVTFHTQEWWNVPVVCHKNIEAVVTDIVTTEESPIGYYYCVRFINPIKRPSRYNLYYRSTHIDNENCIKPINS